MKRYLIFGSAGLGLLMYSIDSTVVAVAFPHLIQDLHTNVLWAGWTVSIPRRGDERDAADGNPER